MRGSVSVPNWEIALAGFAPPNFHRAVTGNAERQLAVLGSQFSVAVGMTVEIPERKASCQVLIVSGGTYSFYH